MMKRIATIKGTRQTQLTVLGELDNEIHKRALRNEKHLCKLNSTVLQLDDIEFKKLFRVTRALLSQLLQDSSPHLKICDHKYRICNVNAKFLRSSHDSLIWRQSRIRQYLAGKHLRLLGDSGYLLESWLIVPFKDPTQEAHILFNNYHSSCRSVIERYNGILKARWRCLKDIHGLHYIPEKAEQIVSACCCDSARAR